MFLIFPLTVPISAAMKGVSRSDFLNLDDPPHSNTMGSRGGS